MLKEAKARAEAAKAQRAKEEALRKQQAKARPQPWMGSLILLFFCYKWVSVEK